MMMRTLLIGNSHVTNSLQYLSGNIHVVDIPGLLLGRAIVQFENLIAPMLKDEEPFEQVLVILNDPHAMVAETRRNQAIFRELMKPCEDVRFIEVNCAARDDGRVTFTHKATVDGLHLTKGGYVLLAEKIHSLVFE